MLELDTNSESGNWLTESKKANRKKRSDDANDPNTLNFNPDQLRDEGGRWTAGGGGMMSADTGQPSGGPTADKKLSEKRNSIAKAVMDNAANVEFTDEPVNAQKNVGSRDYDEIEEAMSNIERETMQEKLDDMETATRDAVFEDYDSDVSEREVAKEIGYDRDGVLDQVAKLIDANVEDEAEAERLKEILDVDRREWGREAIDSAELSLGTIPESLREAIKEFRSAAEEEIDEKTQEWQDADRESAMQSWEYDGRREDRREYLRQFYKDHENEARFGGESGPENVWGADSTAPRDQLYRFTTSGGSGYEITAAREEKMFPTGPDDQASMQRIKALDFMFTDATGNVNITGKAGASGAVEVFKTVTTAIAAMVKRENPDVITFSAADASRQKLYDRLTKTVAGLFPEYAAFAGETEGGRYKQYAAVKRPLKEVAIDYAKAEAARHGNSDLKITPLVNVARGPVEPADAIDPEWFEEAGWEDDDLDDVPTKDTTTEAHRDEPDQD